MSGIVAGSGTPGALSNPVAGMYGALSINADGSYSYDLDDSNATVNGLGAGDSLTDTFTYQITDGDGDSSTTTLTITINGVADTPRVDWDINTDNFVTTGAGATTTSVVFNDNAANTAVSLTNSSGADAIDVDTISVITFTVGGLQDGDSEILNIGGVNFALGTAVADQTITVSANNVEVTVTNVTASTASITITGPSDAVINEALVDDILNSITYQNTATSPTSGDRTLAVQLTDGAATVGNSAVATIRVNTAPVIDLDGSVTGIDYTNSSSVLTVQSATGVRLTDTDLTVSDDATSNGFSSLTVTANNVGTGDQLRIDGGATGVDGGDVSIDLNAGTDSQTVVINGVTYNLAYNGTGDVLTVARDTGNLSTVEARAFLNATHFRNSAFDGVVRTFAIAGIDALTLSTSAAAVATIQTIPVTNDPANFTAVATEDVALDLTLANFGGNAALANIRIDTLGINNGTLFLDVDNDSVVDAGEAVSAADVITRAQLDAGQLSYLSNLNSDVDGSSFTFSVQNTGEDFNLNPATGTINVNPAIDGVDLARVPEAQFSGIIDPSTTIFGPGVDVRIGTANADTIVVSGSTPTVIFAGVGNDTVTGGSGNDTIYGDHNGEVFPISFTIGTTNRSPIRLLDTDGSETITSIVLRNIPNGVVVRDNNGNETTDGTHSVNLGPATVGSSGQNWDLASIHVIAIDQEHADLISTSIDFNLRLDVITTENDSDGGGTQLINLNTRRIFYLFTPTTETAGSDTINGGAGDDIIYGNLGFDTLTGGDGNDMLYDTSLTLFTGGEGDDVFFVRRERTPTSQIPDENNYSDTTLNFVNTALTQLHGYSGGSGNDTLRITEHGTILYANTSQGITVETLDYNGFSDVTIEITSPTAFTLDTLIDFSSGANNGVGATALDTVISRQAYTTGTAFTDSFLGNNFNNIFIAAGNAARGEATGSTGSTHHVRAQNTTTNDVFYAAPGLYAFGGNVNNQTINGNDSFVWGRNTAGVLSTVANANFAGVELIGFNTNDGAGLLASELDVIDLRDLLIREYYEGDATNVTGIGNLASYIDVGSEGDAFLRVNVAGTGGLPASEFNLQIDVNSNSADISNLYGGATTNAQRIENLIENGILLVDNQGGATSGATAGGDAIMGTAAADSIAGEGGNDTISGLAGNDYLHGWEGVDTIYGGSNTNAIAAGNVAGINSGSDTNTGTGNDEIYGGAGADILYGQDGDDVIKGDQQVQYNILETNDAEGAVGSNSVDGAQDSDDIIRGGSGSDTIYSNGGDDILVWGVGDHGTAGAANRDTDIVMDFRRFDEVVIPRVPFNSFTGRVAEDDRDGQDVLNLRDLLEGENQNTINVNGASLNIGNLADYLYIETNVSGVNLYIDHDGTSGTNAGILAGAADTTAAAQLTAAQANADLLITLKSRPDLVVGTDGDHARMLDYLISNSIVITDTV